MSRRKILVVDDEHEIFEIVQTNLEGAGYEVIGADAGVAGLRLARQEKPDLVILDILMPEMDGWEVLREIENDSRIAGLPVIMLTCKGEDSDILRGLEEGAIEYLTKPFYPENLVASVQILLNVFDTPMREERRQLLIQRRQRLMGKNPGALTTSSSSGSYT